MGQNERMASLDRFKTAETPLLVATDVAARGLDIPNVEYVVNYTFPLTIEDYVHRIGRTGRGGKTGKSVTYFTEEDKAHAGELVKVLRDADQPVPKEMDRFPTSKFIRSLFRFQCCTAAHKTFLFFLFVQT